MRIARSYSDSRATCCLLYFALPCHILDANKLLVNGTEQFDLAFALCLQHL